MADLEKIHRRLIKDDKNGKSFLSSPAMLILTLSYLVLVLSVPVSQPQKLIWMAAYPIIGSELSGIGFCKIFGRSLWILPIVFLIGILNPILDKTPAFKIGNLDVSTGWVSFIAIILRGLLSFQAILLLIETTGFNDIFRTMRYIGLPKILCTQLMLTYRYIAVLLEEVIIMKRARMARGYGKDSYPIKMWGQFIGQLLIRCVQRATAIHRAMIARGFNGTLPTGSKLEWNLASVIRLIIAIVIIGALRFIDFSRLISISI